MKRVVMATVVAALFLASAGCANNGPTAVSVKAARALAPFVTALREAASHDSIDEVEARVSDLDSEVSNLVESNDITQKRGKSIEDAASALESDFKRKNTPTPPPTSTSPSTSPTESSNPPKPGPTVTITVPPTDSGSPEPSDTETKGNGDGKGNGFGNGGEPPGHDK